MAQIRSNVARVFNFTRAHRKFKSDEEFDAYLELEQDIVYDLTYGDARQQKEAMAALKKFEQDNKADIETNRAQCIGASAALAAAGGDMDVDGGASTALAAASAGLDAPLFPSLPFNAELAAAAAATRDSHAADEFHHALLQQAPHMRTQVQEAGGYSASLCVERCQAEAWNSMWAGVV